MKWNP